MSLDNLFPFSFVLYLFSLHFPVSIWYLVVSHTKLKLMCLHICFSINYYSLDFCLLARLIPQTQRRNREDCHHPCERKRREDQGPGDLLGFVIIINLSKIIICSRISVAVLCKTLFIFVNVFKSEEIWHKFFESYKTCSLFSVPLVILWAIVSLTNTYQLLIIELDHFLKGKKNCCELCFLLQFRKFKVSDVRIIIPANKCGFIRLLN